MTALPLGAPYRRLWSATLLSNLGDGIRAAAFPLLAATLTGNPVLIAGVAVAGELPRLLFGLVAGAVADRFDRRRLVVAVDIARLSLLTGLVVMITAHVATITVVYAVVFACGLAEVVRDTTAVTMVPSLVSREHLGRANGRMITAEIAGNEFIGPPLGGYLFGVALVLPFAVNSGTLALAAALIATIPAMINTGQDRDTDQAPSRSGVVGDIASGVRWFSRHRDILSVPVTTVALAMTDSAWFTLLVLYVHQVLELPAVWYGLLLAAGALGGLAGGFFAARVAAFIGARRATLGCLALAALGQLILGTTSSVAATMVVLATSSMAFAVWNVIARTAIQRRTPAELLGRISSINTTAVTAASILGAIVGGLTADRLGLHAPFLLGLPLLLAAIVFVATRPASAEPTASTTRS
ncbi:MAG TPA: MFS transporter [Microlunatus sp.]|nr:MFS transporter [Microlunatus sp.]